MLVSFIMPAKNASKYILEAIDGVKRQKVSDWELIIIEDHSEDNTYEIANKVASHDHRIRIFKNTGVGKVEGLNYGYTLSTGNIIKCIDADDVLHESFLDYCFNKDFEAMCHSSYITDSKLNIISQRSISHRYLEASFEETLEWFLGIARWAWTIKKDIADKIFPMPTSLPYEDLWFSFVIKRYVSNIFIIKEPLYYYRQHENQTYGGVYSYKPKIVTFRAKRKIKYLNILKENHSRLSYPKNKVDDLLKMMDHYLQFMSKEKINIQEILRSKIPKSLKFKIIGIKNFPRISSSVKKYKDIILR